MPVEITTSAPLWLIVGVLLGGLVEVIVQQISAYKESRGIALALAAELGALRELVIWRQYSTLLDERIAALQNPDHVFYVQDIFAIHLTQKYFTVFESVSAKIGFLGDLSARVVGTYALIKAMLEDLDQLNALHQALINSIGTNPDPALGPSILLPPVTVFYNEPHMRTELLRLMQDVRTVLDRLLKSQVVDELTQWAALGWLGRWII